MAKTRHEVRDAIHGFIEFNNTEKQVIDSAPMQRLRNIHQLALTYQVYPGATHRRFEHSLGVMSVATRIFDRLFNTWPGDQIGDRIAFELENKDYWRRVVRMAALLHDVGHLPFSHAAEDVLLPDGWDHERITAEIIRKSEIASILRRTSAAPSVEDVVDVAYSPKARLKNEPTLELEPWKALLNEIITGNTFGADRIDYLLRDSLHAGVAYGRFDPDRLIDSLRLVVDPASDQVSIGLDVGGIHGAEALLLARYFMFTQVYLHHVRRAYDIHLQDYLAASLPGGQFAPSWKKMLAVSDNEVLADLVRSAGNPKDRNYEMATRVVSRAHFRRVYTLSSSHKKLRPTVLDDVYKLAQDECGPDSVRISQYGPRSEANNFRVLQDDGTLESSQSASGVISQLPSIEISYVFVRKDLADEMKKKLANWLRTNLPEDPNGL